MDPNFKLPRLEKLTETMAKRKNKRHQQNLSFPNVESRRLGAAYNRNETKRKEKCDHLFVYLFVGRSTRSQRQRSRKKFAGFYILTKRDF